MFSRVNIACGLDVHYSKIVGSIVTSDGTSETRTFTTNIDDTLKLRDWISFDVACTTAVKCRIRYDRISNRV